MTITQYFKRRSREMAQKSRRFRDARVFDFNHIPDQPVMRNEAKTIIDACLRYVSTGIPNHLFVFGSAGSGKTLMMRYVARLLGEQPGTQALYANCRQCNTSYKILARLLKVHPRGVSLDELWHRFLDTLDGPLVLILDEIDLLSDRDRRNDILYLLSRSPRPIMAVLLSNHPRMLNALDESIRSSLQPELVNFRNYDAQQMLKILRERAAAGLKAFGEDRLAQIAALTVRQTRSDVRVAIKTLYYAALEPDADLTELFDHARRDLVTEVMADLNDRNLLMAPSRELPGRSSADPSTASPRRPAVRPAFVVSVFLFAATSERLGLNIKSQPLSPTRLSNVMIAPLVGAQRTTDRRRPPGGEHAARQLRRGRRSTLRRCLDTPRLSRWDRNASHPPSRRGRPRLIGRFVVRRLDRSSAGPFSTRIRARHTDAVILHPRGRETGHRGRCTSRCQISMRHQVTRAVRAVRAPNLSQPDGRSEDCR
ncbi:MAG: AAA family ATPase [Acidimicrobiia bacterium]|nr:AAA family ATPase [Acidimicrobiia bacterium]